jgi:hypothetical protein
VRDKAGKILSGNSKVFLGYGVKTLNQLTEADLDFGLKAVRVSSEDLNKMSDQAFSRSMMHTYHNVSFKQSISNLHKNAVPSTFSIA